VLVVIVVTLGPLLGYVPLRLLQFAIGVLLLLLLGMRWLPEVECKVSNVIALFGLNVGELMERLSKAASPT
jgi:uncharacterized membrane protein